jgi:hypothetical protein
VIIAVILLRQLNESTIFMMLRIVAILIVLVPSTAFGDLIYFTWTPTGSTTGNGIAGNVSATYSLLPNVSQIDYTSTDPAFVSEYGSTMPGFEIDQSFSLSGTFTFSNALPDGSIMTILDIDNGEVMAFSSVGTFSLIEHVDRIANSTSTMPDWDDGQQRLTALVGSQSNSAASIFDVSGVSQMSFNFTSPPPTGAAIAFAVSAVPEPGSVTLMMAAMAGLSLSRKRRPIAG